MRKPIMMAAAGLFAVTAVSACNRNRPKSFSGPATANGLECALRIAADSGYVPQRGGLAQGFVFLQHDRRNTLGEKTKEAATRIVTLGQKGVDRATADRLNIVGAASELHITASSLDEQLKEGKPTEDGERISRFILLSCAP